MIPEIEANQLIEKFLRYTPVEFEHEYAVQCAIIFCDEVINIFDNLEKDYHKGYFSNDKLYWLSVKQILQNKI